MLRPHTHRIVLFLVLFLFIFGSSGTVLAADIPGESAAPVVIVTTTGTTSVDPDQARLALAVVTDSKNLSQAQNENNLITSKVMDTLRSLGINDKDIQTSRFTVHPQYDYSDKASNLIGYQVRNEITIVITDISKVGTVLDKAITAGANNINQISFEKSNLDAAENEALLQAIARGHEKAQLMAAAAQMTLGPLVSISEGYHVPLSVNVASLDRGAGGGPVPISPGELKVSATVTMVYQLN